MQKLRERMKDQKGFTLVEMLIVVAIIAILVAVSIPMVTSTLENARHKVDDANFRDAAALGSIEYLQNPDAFKTSAKTYWYCVADKTQQGKLLETPDTTFEIYVKQCTGQTGCPTYAGDNIKVTVGTDGTTTVEWATKS